MAALIACGRSVKRRGGVLRLATVGEAADSIGRGLREFTDLARLVARLTRVLTITLDFGVTTLAASRVASLPSGLPYPRRTGRADVVTRFAVPIIGIVQSHMSCQNVITMKSHVTDGTEVDGWVGVFFGVTSKRG